MSFEFEDAIELPEMAALSERQRKFVWHYAQDSDGNATRAALAAGYAESSAKVSGWTLTKRDDVGAALKAITGRMMAEGSLLAVKAVIKIVRDPMHKDHLRACQDLMNRAGFAPVVQMHHTVEKKLNEVEQMAQYADLAKALGVPLRSLVGPNVAIPLEHEDVTPSAEGIEDLLGLPPPENPNGLDTPTN